MAIIQSRIGWIFVITSTVRGACIPNFLKVNNEYFVMQACKIEELGQVDFDEAVKARQQMLYVPNWFTVDLKTGMLTIHLGQDENDCLSAWVSARYQKFSKLNSIHGHHNSCGMQKTTGTIGGQIDTSNNVTCYRYS
jgi:hypothetical protein